MKKFLPFLAIFLLWMNTSAFLRAQAPNVNTYLPDLNAPDVALDVTLELTFDVNIAFNSSSTRYYVEIYKEGEAPPVEEYQINYGTADPGLTINNSTLSISPQSNLSPGEAYYVNISPDGIVSLNDSTGFSGITDNTTWRFTTVSRPGLTSQSPTNSATGVTGLESLVLNYDEAVSLGNNKNLHIYKSGGILFQTINTTNDAGLISIDGTNTQVTISHEAFNGNQDFYIDVEEGFVTSQASSVASAAIDGTTEWSFTTTNGPALSFSPGPVPEGNVHADDPLKFVYSEDITLQANKDIRILRSDNSIFQTINTTTNSDLISYDSNTFTLTVNHDNFKGNSTYKVEADEGLVRANSNDIASQLVNETTTGWNFTTLPPPSLSFNSPTDNAIDVTANEPLMIAFSEAVSLQSNKNIIIYNSDDTPFQTINTDTNSDLFSFNTSNDLLTIDHNTFSGSSGYYVNIEEGLAVSNTTAIATDAVTGTSAWSFSTASGPSISSFTPDGDTDVNGNQQLNLNFSENISLGDNKNLHIYRSSDDQLFQTINSTSDADLLNAVDATIQIDHNPLWGNTSFYILVDEGFATSSTTSLDGEGITSTSRWTFSTAYGPAADSFTPATAAADISITNPLEIDFNENISLGSSGAVTIHLLSDDSVVETIDWDSGQLSVSNDTLTINHAALAPETGYYVTIDNSLILSATTGTPWEGISDQSWNFTTGGAPAITGYSPLNGETSAPVNQVLTLTFDENIKQGSTGYVKIRTGDDQFFQDIPYDAGQLTFSGSELQITHAEFDPESTYYVTLETGVVASASTDVPFQGFTDINQWRFTTATPPSIDTYAPTNGSTLTSASQSLTLTFNENIELGTTCSFRIFYSEGTSFQNISIENTENISITDNELTITHDDFVPNSSFYVLIDQGFIKSVASGVEFPGISQTDQWTFNTPAGPQISTYDPANNSTDIAVDAILTLTFDENIDRGTGNMVIHHQSDGSDAVTIAAASTNLTISGNTLSFPNLTMPHESTLYVTMDAGFVKSSATGFEFSGISNSAEWVFTTLPEPPAWSNGYPYYSSISPSNIDLALMTSRESDYYFVVTSNSTPPSIAQIMSGQNSGGTAAHASGNGSLSATTEFIHSGIDISGLSEGYHWVHAVAKNPTKELYSAIATLQIDKLAPATTMLPSDGTSHFSESGNMIISFDEPIYTSGAIVDNTSVASLVSLVLESDDSPVSFTATVNGSATQITVDPDSDLSPETSYILTMSAIEDEVGNLQSGNTISTFTTDKLNTWTGGGSDPSDWSDADNWSSGNGAFSDGTSIYVPASASAFPEVSSNKNLYNVNIEAGAALTHSSGTLTVNGEFRLQSSTLANASYINSGGTLSIANTDSIKIEQHITDLTHVYNISSPVSGATKNSIGLDDQLYYYDNSSNTWVEMGDTDIMTTGRGYVGKSSQNLVFSGAIKTDGQIIDLIRTPS
ncbi:Ig-like domain-containing domain, partial [Marinilabilia sp.]